MKEDRFLTLSEKDINYDWIDKQIEKIDKKDTKLTEQRFASADYLFWKYIEQYPNHEELLVFWDEEDDCGKDTELGQELFEYIENELEEKLEEKGE
jgi:hypothetical protein